MEAAREHLAHDAADSARATPGRRETERWTLLHEAEGDERVRAAPFEAIELDLARLWAL